MYCLLKLNFFLSLLTVKILQVIPSLNPAMGGTVKALVSTLEPLQSRGHEVTVLCLDDTTDSWILSFKHPVVCFKGSGGTYRYSKNFSTWLSNHTTMFDIVVIHGIWQYHSYISAKVCNSLKVPYVLFTHGMLDPWFNQVSKIKALKKNIYWKIFEKQSVNNADAVLFTCEEEKVLARKSFTPYRPNEKVVAFGSPRSNVCGEAAKDKFYQIYPDLQCKKIALYLSRIHPKKGIDLLIDAMKDVDLPEDFILVIAGPDPDELKPRLHKRAQELGVANKIVWVGMLQGLEKWGAYYAADVFILPSHQENFGIVVSESLSVGTPVLITDKVNIWREIKESGSGIVSPDTVSGVCSLLTQWFSLSYDEKLSMRNRALACFEKNFSLEKSIPDFEMVLNTIKKNRNLEMA